MTWEAIAAICFGAITMLRWRQCGSMAHRAVGRPRQMSERAYQVMYLVLGGLFTVVGIMALSGLVSFRR